MPGVGLIILAAGGSRRLGEPKQLLPFRGKPLLRQVGEIALGSICRPVVAVLGANAERILPALRNLPLKTVVNPEWESGMTSSIGAGMSAILGDNPENPRVDSVIILLCDQPMISIQLINGLVARQTATGCGIVASSYGNTRGVPALFTKKYFRALLTLEENGGAKQIIMRHSSDVGVVAFPEGKFDIDTQEDYISLMSNESLRMIPITDIGPPRVF